jgi:predicted HTH domain antitoxin
MSIKSIRISEDLEQAIAFVSNAEKIEKAHSLRKLARLGFESYIAQLYKQGRLSLRESASILQLTLTESIDLFAENGVKGNIESEQVLNSLQSLDFMP